MKPGSKSMASLPQSYVHGACDATLIGDTIGVHFDNAARRWCERPALIVRHQNIRWSYGELKDRVDAFAGGLLALGIEPGDRVGIWSPNNAEWAITQFATAKLGAVLVNINPAYRLAEREYARRHRMDPEPPDPPAELRPWVLVLTLALSLIFVISTWPHR